MPSFRFITIVILTSITLSVSSQYKIRVKCKEWTDTTLVLGTYLGDKMFVTDSVRLDSKGRASFESDTLLPQGLYTLYFPNKSYFDILIGKNQALDIEIPTKNLSKGIKISGGKESVAFSEYQAFMNNMQQKRGAILEHYKPFMKNKDSLAIARKKMELLNTQVQHMWDQELHRIPNSFYATIIKSFMPAPTPPKWNLPPSLKNDSIKSARNYYFNATHHFDNTALNDMRLWRTPFHQKKIQNYLKNLLIPIPDSIIPHALTLILESKSDPEAFRQTASTVLNFAVKSEIMGMESLSVSIAKLFYLSGDAYWADSTLLSKLRDLVLREEPSLLGKTAHELVLEDWEAGYKSLHQVNSPYTVLVFWEPGCSHCKETIPKLYHDIWEKYKSKGLAFFAVYTQNDKKEWTDFIINHELFEWNHVYDQHNRSNFRFYYNITVTPKIYLLDKDKKIIGKNIGVENLGKMLDRLYLYGKLY